MLVTVTEPVTRTSQREGFPPGAPPAGEKGKGVAGGVKVVVDVGVAEMYGYMKPGTEWKPAGAL